MKILMDIQNLTLSARKLISSVALLVGLFAGSIANALEWKNSEIECLARNIYFESLNQSLLGQLAVAHVTLNRVSLKRYPNSLCGVVTDSKKKSNGEVRPNACQFSWYCDGKDDTPKNITLYENAITVAKVAIQIFYTFGDMTGGATHYHAYYVIPSWSRVMQRVARIDDHIFYDYRRRIVEE